MFHPQLESSDCSYMDKEFRRDLDGLFDEDFTEEQFKDFVVFVLVDSLRSAESGENLLSICLDYAASKGYPGSVESLFQEKLELASKIGLSGRTPLHWAAIGGHVSVIEAILSTRPDAASILSKRGETILHFSAMNKQSEAIKVMLEKFKLTNLISLADHNGDTVLHLAAKAGSLEIIDFLLLDKYKHQIDVNAVNNNGSMALDILQDSVGATYVGGNAQDGVPNGPDLTRVIQKLKDSATELRRLSTVQILFGLSFCNENKYKKGKHCQTTIPICTNYRRFQFTHRKDSRGRGLN